METPGFPSKGMQCGLIFYFFWLGVANHPLKYRIVPKFDNEMKYNSKTERGLSPVCLKRLFWIQTHIRSIEFAFKTVLIPLSKAIHPALY